MFPVVPSLILSVEGMVVNRKEYLKLVEPPMPRHCEAMAPSNVGDSES